jgi:hypothetical protein
MNISDDKEAERWHRRYDTFVRLYRGRDDVIAERQEDGSYLPVEGAGLTLERFLAHVGQKKTFAIYNMDDLKRVSFGLFDVDVPERKQGWSAIRSGIEAKREETLRIMKTLLDMGLKRDNLLLEFPTVGFHILIFFKDPVPAKNVKHVMGRVLHTSGLMHIPFYPRKIEDNPHGDRIQLPLRMNMNTFMRSNFIRDLDHFDPEHYREAPDFSVLEKVAPMEAEWVNRWIDEGQATPEPRHPR